MKFRYVAALAAVGLVAAPAAAQAATKDVVMGPTPKVSKSLEKFAGDLNNYYPTNISVRRGDKVRFTPFGFHNAHFPKKGAKPIALFAPSGTAQGVNDAAGAPFWFNGLPTFGFTPSLMQSAFGKTVTYTGAKTVESGLPLGDRPKPFTVKFTKQGTHTYFCTVHPGMKAKVTVKSPRAQVPSAKADKARAEKQMAKDAKAVAGLVKAKLPANTVSIGAATASGAETFAILPGGNPFPGKITVPVGTTVTFRMDPQSRETHTATFGPGNPEQEPNSYLGQIAKSFEGPGPFDGRATYPSEKPGDPVANYTTTLHGNGFWSSGAMQGAKSSPLPDSAQLRFAQAGTFTFYCLIHPFQVGTVTVT